MDCGTACRTKHLSTVYCKLPRSMVIDITYSDKCFSLEELCGLCLIICIVGLFVFPFSVLYVAEWY